jgi:hypothetical protein
MKNILMKKIFLFLSLVIISSTSGISEGAEMGEPIKLYYHDPAQVELISPRGSRVFIDAIVPIELSSPSTEKDVLLTTHGHGDHYISYFADSFPGEQLCIRVGEIKMADAMIRGIASSHNERDIFREKGGSNYIFIIDMGGLRIAHFGDIGQNALTPEQLAALGKVDIAVTQLSNPFSGMNAANKKGFRLMDQLKPRLIIPTHIFESTCVKMAVDKWDAYCSHKNFLSITKNNLPDRTCIIFMDKNAEHLDLPEFAF